ncbi:MAG: hypothetical protein IOD12_03615 [Silvanigrellales bacterium]|nr:hypothetical protein [Silvanigrellales bacterium]
MRHYSPKQRFLSITPFLAFGLLVSAVGCQKKNPLSQAKDTSAPAAPAKVDLAGGVSAECATLRTKILELKATDTTKLEAILAEYVGEPGSPRDINSFAEADTRFYVAQLHVLQALRSVIWRASGIFETKSFLGRDKTHKDFRIAQNSGFSALRAMAAGLEAFLPDSPAQVAFRYLVEPSVEAVKAGKYASVSAMQADLQKKLAATDGTPGALQTLLATLKGLESTVSDAKPLVWDARLAFGAKAYDGGQESKRYEAVGTLELKALLAATHLALHDLYVFNAYNYDAAPHFFGSVSKKFGLDGLLGDDIEGLPASTLLADLTPNPKAGVTAENDYVTLFTLRSDVGAAYLRTAFETHLKPSLTLARQVLEGVEGRGQDAVTRAPLVREWFGRNTFARSKEALSIVELLVAGKTTLASPITGETATFDLPAFYLKPASDLKQLLPNVFETSKEKWLVGADGKTKYRNYWWGRPTGWRSVVDTYVEGGSAPGGMDRAGRVVSHMGGIGLNNPLVDFVALGRASGAQ